jgi:hypothetical protein
MLRTTARAEIRTYRDVSLAVMARMGKILNWLRWQRTLLMFGIHLKYAYEQIYGWRRMVRLRMLQRLDALRTCSSVQEPPYSPICANQNHELGGRGSHRSLIGLLERPIDCGGALALRV